MSKQEMTPEQREQKEQEEFQTGPLRVLTDSVKNNTQVLINCRYHHTTPHHTTPHTRLPGDGGRRQRAQQEPAHRGAKGLAGDLRLLRRAGVVALLVLA